MPHDSSAASVPASQRRAQHVTVVFGGNFLALPVHAGGGGVINLDAVHPGVALACFRIAGDHAWQRDEPAAILRPALQDGKIQQREIFFLDDLFARAGGNDLGEELAHIGEHGQHLQLFQKAFRRLHVEQLADALGNFVQGIDAKSHLHAALRAELVDQHRNAIPAFNIFKQQARARRGAHTSWPRLWRPGRRSQ